MALFHVSHSPWLRLVGVRTSYIHCSNISWTPWALDPITNPFLGPSSWLHPASTLSTLFGGDHFLLLTDIQCLVNHYFMYLVFILLFLMRGEIWSFHSIFFGSKCPVHSLKVISSGKIFGISECRNSFNSLTTETEFDSRVSSLLSLNTTYIVL